MRHTRWVLLLGLVLITAGPAFAQDTCEIQRQVDETTGAVTALSTVPDFRQVLLLEYAGARGEGNVSISLAYQPGMLQLGIYFVGMDRAFLEGDGLLEVTINGQEGPVVQAIGVQTQDLEDAFLEVIAFNLSEDDFRRIAEGEKVRFRLPARRRLDRELRPVHLNCFKSFLAEMEK